MIQRSLWNPEDDRYRKYIGKVIKLPITQRKIQIIADNYVDPSFGSMRKITPAHDFNDYEIGKRHGLEVINILNEDGTLNDQVPKDTRVSIVSTQEKRLLKNLVI